MTDDLRNRGVIRKLDVTLRPSLYGIMVFGKHPQAYLPEPEIVNGPVARVVRVTLWRGAP